MWRIIGLRWSFLDLVASTWAAFSFSPGCCGMGVWLYALKSLVVPAATGWKFYPSSGRCF
uniref:Uncharacterized protein n=1 Tax=Setaria viridis TaxID=4556 RepID=A0A4U6UK00_SETVI|nr:hypothetical protein SEVIR_5G313366v2 [Setaria viridis]